jgi:ketosteroid isomerase-like protein
MKLRALVTIALLLAMTASHAQTRDTPRAVVDRFLAALNHLSVEEMTPIFTNDATAFFPIAVFGQRLNGRAAIMDAFNKMFTQEKQRIAQRHGVKGKATVVPAGMMTARDIAVQQIGKDTAVVTFDVGTGSLYSRRTAVVVARGGRWQIVHLHASNLRM